MKAPKARPDLRAAVKRFLTSYLPQHRGASAHTITSYAQALKGLLGFLSARGKKRKPIFRDLTAENVLAFLAQLERKRKNGPSTRNVRLAGVLSFLRFAFLMGCVDKDAYERLRHIAFKRGPLRAAAYLEVAELDAIFHAVDYRTRDGFRDLTILKTLYNTGARASEIAAIKISNLALDDLHVTITGKGRKPRLCGLWETTVALDLLVDDIRGYSYVVIRTGGVCVLLNEYEARALSVAVDGLSPQATGMGSARDGAGRGSPDAPGER